VSQRCHLRFDTLEDRSVPANFGLPWADPRHLTLSFVPDQTRIASHESSLFQALDSQFPRAVWQRELARAFQTWAVEANLDFGVRPDGGQAFGTAGPMQGDARFGDIRIGAHAMTPEALSVSVPGDVFFAGTWAGDVLLNSAANFTAAPADLYSILLHEVGHVLGLEHSSEPGSVMFTHAAQTRTGLAASDVQSLRALYGVRGPDFNELEKPNDTMRRATGLKFSQESDGFDGSTPVVAYGDITSKRDVDWFYLKPLDGYDGPITFRLQSAGLSLLAAKMTVTDEDGQVVGQAQMSNPLGDTAYFTIANPAFDMTYFVKVESATQDVFGMGRFAILATFDDELDTAEAKIQETILGPFDALSPSELQKLFSPDDDDVYVNDDGHLDDDAPDAGVLKPAPGYVSNAHYQVLGSVLDATDVDWYNFKSFRSADGQPTVSTIAVSALDLNGTLPRVELFDALGRPVATRILVNGNGSLTIQGENLASDSVYLLKVSPTDGQAAGNYSLSIDNGVRRAQLNTFIQSQVIAGVAKPRDKFFVAQSQLFHVMLSADALGAPANATVRMTITRAKGPVVFTMTARPGETVTSNALFLTPGKYRVKYTLEGAGPGGRVSFRVQGANLTDPIGPVPDDPTLKPMYSSPTNPGAYEYPGGISSTNPYLWLALAL
jgi:hypothetical protein